MNSFAIALASATALAAALVAAAPVGAHADFLIKPTVGGSLEDAMAAGLRDLSKDPTQSHAASNPAAVPTPVVHQKRNVQIDWHNCYVMAAQPIIAAGINPNSDPVIMDVANNCMRQLGYDNF